MLLPCPNRALLCYALKSNSVDISNLFSCSLMRRLRLDELVSAHLSFL